MEPMQTKFEGTDVQGAEDALLAATKQYEAVEKRARVAWLRDVKTQSTKNSFIEWVELHAIKHPDFLIAKQALDQAQAQYDAVHLQRGGQKYEAIMIKRSAAVKEQEEQKAKEDQEKLGDPAKITDEELEL